MSKAHVREIIELRREGFSQAEIIRRLGVSKSFVSNCLSVQEVLAEDIEAEKKEVEAEKKKVEEERGAVKQEKEEHRKNVEEVLTIKRKLSELKGRKKEMENEYQRAM